MATGAEKIASVLSAENLPIADKGKPMPEAAVPALVPAPASVAEPVSPAAAMLHLESVDRFHKIPLVEAACNQSADIYDAVKGANTVFTWSLNAAEATAQRVAELAVYITNPVANKLGTPINFVDRTVVKGIDFVEERVPLFKKQPKQIYEMAKSYVAPLSNKMSAVANYSSQKIKAMTDLTSAKAKGMLSAPATAVYGFYAELLHRMDQYWKQLFPGNKAVTPAAPVASDAASHPAAPAPATTPAAAAATAAVAAPVASTATAAST